MMAGDRRSGPSAAAAAGSALEWRADDEFSLDGVSYVCRPRADTVRSSADRFCIRKPRKIVEHCEALVRRLAPRRIAEVGIYDGGSMALLAQLARPERLIGFDITEDPSPALDQFAAAHGFSETLSAYWGVDQADRERLNSILDEEIGGMPLDLVIDDASHLLDESRLTFDALFPRLRPGGEYVLEDWAWAHAIMEVWPETQPLTVLVAEATIACAYHPHVISSIEIDRPWAVIRRGEADLEPATFSLRGSLGARGERLIDGMLSGGITGGGSASGRAGPAGS